MEDILQRVFAILMATLVFFFLPLYIAFEKKDDISYSLALSITSNFVNDVTNKGYITEKMYNDYVSNLAVTGNSYDIKLEHISKKYNPVIYAVDSSNKTVSFDYATYADKITTNASGQKVIEGCKNPTLSYKLSTIKYNEKQILKVLDSSPTALAKNIANLDYYKGLGYNEIPLISGMYKINKDTSMYTMNKGDEFTVVIKNTNTTVATVLFNVLTLGANIDNNTKVYINYGGTIQNEEYRTTILEKYENVEAKEDNTSSDGTSSSENYDITGDGVVDNNDVNKLKSYLAGIREGITEEEKKKMDINKDTVIDSKDAVALQKYINDNS